MASRSHLSIGEVLSLLRREFPDVTISKIRFLESQGLVDPERTPSGYRKFYEADVERLRWILLQQREHFLPLKVIKGRLDSSGSLLDGEGSDDADLRASVDHDGAYEPAYGDRGSTPEKLTPAHSVPEHSVPAHSVPAHSASEHSASEQSIPEQSIPEQSTRERAATGGVARPAIFAGLAHGDSPNAQGGGAHLSEGYTGTDDEQPDSYTAAELASAAGCSPKLVADLTQFGLVGPLGHVGGPPYYDRCSLDICRAASRFAAFGVEARHLRGWRTAAEREVDLFSQLVVPLLRQRNPKGRGEADEALNELAAAGAELRAAFVRRAISAIR